MKPTMYYDGDCPLCRREVAHYRRIEREGRIRWIDISREPEALAALGVDLKAAIQRLHATDEQGQVVTGVSAFVAIWRQLPGYRHLAWLVSRLGLIPILDRAYDRFAAWRLRRRCAGGTCQAP